MFQTDYKPIELPDYPNELPDGTDAVPGSKFREPPTWPIFRVFGPFLQGKVGTRLAKVENSFSSLNTLKSAR